ncbi:GNAT family N-acetyltransferase [soil metagenome]
MNFILRQWTMADLESLVENANNSNISKFMNDGFPNPYTNEDGKKFIEFAMPGNPINIFAIEVNGKAVGGIGIHPQQDVMRKNAELGYWLGEQYWGNGIISKAIKEIVEYAFKNFDITRIYARPFSNNIPSQKVLEKAGFVLEATIADSIFKNDIFLDELIYAVRR